MKAAKPYFRKHRLVQAHELVAGDRAVVQMLRSDGKPGLENVECEVLAVNERRENEKLPTLKIRRLDTKEEGEIDLSEVSEGWRVAP